MIDALATLAYDGRRASFFRTELLKALHVVEQAGVAPAHMLGSYAGAMGQPQFMPSAYMRYAASYPAGGRADIWHNEAMFLPPLPTIWPGVAGRPGSSGGGRCTARCSGAVPSWPQPRKTACMVGAARSKAPCWRV